MRQFKKSESGVLTIQFMMAFVVIMFFIVSFLGLSLTLTYASLTQYVTYSAARKQFLAGPAAGKNKYNEISRRVLPGGWFDIEKPEDFGVHGKYVSPKPRRPAARNLFYGVWVNFKSKITQFKIPGMTQQGWDEEQLDTTIGSYLGREVSAQDCQNFFQTVSQFNMKNSEYGYNGDMPGFETGTLVFKSDNGCG